MRPHRLSQSTSLSRLGPRRALGIVHQPVTVGLRAENRGIVHQPVTVGLRAEHPSRRWERRVPLTPTSVADLIQSTGARVFVAPSSKRCYPDAAFARAGATITPDLSEADYVLGVKEPQLHELETAGKRRTHLSFWHTHKGSSRWIEAADPAGQSYNRPLARKMLASGDRFVDWELITDASGARTTAFGSLAGIAGMADGLSIGLAMRLLGLGHSSPFMYLPRPLSHPSLDDLYASLRKVGDRIRDEGTPAALGPLTIAVVGRGRVGQGCKTVLDSLGVEWVAPSELKALASSDASLRSVYAAQVTMEDHLRGSHGQSFDREAFAANPRAFHSVFADEIAPYTTMLANGAFWAAGSPRLLTHDQLRSLRSRLRASGDGDKRMLTVVDIACDFNGGLEFVNRATTIDEPVFMLDEHGQEHNDHGRSDSTQVCSIEIFPSELPVASSEHFSACALPYLKTLCSASFADSKHLEAIDRATLIADGQLTPPHAWLAPSLASPSGPTSKKRVLVLGSGLVAGPAIDTLAARSDVDVTLATNDLVAGLQLARDRARCVELQVGDAAQLEALVKASDVTLSLLPAPLHAQVAEVCIKHGSHLVTASYTSAEMKALHQRAADAGIILLNELGLDPGLDHMSARALIDSALSAGSEIRGFVSMCGGLPAPEVSMGPLAYRCSWSPRGVLTAATNDARFRLGGVDHAIAGEDLLARTFADVPAAPTLALEAIANRDSLTYAAPYGLAETIPTLMRGTLRYRGFCRLLNAFKAIGLLDQRPLLTPLASWSELVDAVVTRTMGLAAIDPAARRSLITDALAARNVSTDVDEVLYALEWLDLFAVHETAPPASASALDLFAIVLASKLKYQLGERDMVTMTHELAVKQRDGSDAFLTSRLIAYGDPTDPGNPATSSAMSKTVGIPAALGALLALDGGIKARGVVTPMAPEVYSGLLPALADRGIVMTETVERRPILTALRL